MLLVLVSATQTPAQTPSAKPSLIVAPLEKLRTQIQTTLAPTKPDFIVFTPKLSATGVHDSGNEHFLVFDGPDKSLMAVWTQSTHEGAADQHVVFARSDDGGKNWVPPRIIAGPAREGEKLMSSWGFPVVSKKGRIYVLYSQNVGKFDTFPHTTGQLTGIYSDDNGKTWTEPQTVPLPRTFRDNPDTSYPANCIIWQKPLRLTKDGHYLVGLTRWTSDAVKKNPTKSWATRDSVVEFLRFDNLDENPEPADLKLTGLAWDKAAITVPCQGYPEISVAQEPSIVKLPDGRLFCVMRTMSGSPYWTISADDGETWAPARPLLRKDGGAALQQPLSPCPVFDLGGNNAGSGHYALFIHNHDGHYQNFAPLDSNYHRRPVYEVIGHFQPGAEQPIWFDEPKFFMDHDGVPLGAPGKQGRIDLALYSSVTVHDGKAILWYPDRKFFLLGKYLTDESGADLQFHGPPAADLHWLSLTNGELTVNGLPWFNENGGTLERLPERCKDSYRPAIWSLAKSPSGGRIRFRTDSKVLALQLEYPGGPNMANMHAFGQTGVDVYVDGACISTATADADFKPGKCKEHISFDFSDRPRVEREITIYLPLYKPVKIHGIGVDPGAQVGRARDFACAKPVVFYGTSITQGGAASRPGMSYPAILGRMLDIDFVNLGFSGNGLGEPEVARAVAEIDAACFVLDFGANHKTLEEMQKAYGPFLDILRASHPTTPILVLSPIYTVREARSDTFEQDWQKRRAYLRETVKQRRKSGDKHIGFVEGTDLLGPSRRDGLVDGSHPNDLGFHWMAEGLAPYLQEVLKLHQPSATTTDTR